nr:WSC domain-containing protein 1-like [Lytechinus pictus]
MPNGTFPLTALASYPGSGNTWMRHLIETSTGYASGNSKPSYILVGAGFKGERVPHFAGRTLTIKTHTFHPRMDSSILLVRNPYRAMVAEFNRQKAGKTGHAEDNIFRTEDWRRYVKKQSQTWFKLYEKYISECNHLGHTCKSMLIVYYEQLQLHLKDELRRILNYLGVMIDEERLTCTVRNSEGQFHRPKSNKTLDPFFEEDRRFVEESLKKYIDLIEQEGLEKPPLSLSAFPTDL